MSSPSLFLWGLPSSRAALALASSLGLLTACADGDAGDATPGAGEASVVFAALEQLTVVNAQADPWSGHRPDDIDCNPLTGWYVEGDELEVNTGDCNYATLMEPSRSAAAPGDHLLFTLSHYDLTAAEPAQAHVAVAVGDTLLYAATLAIPGPADVVELDIELKQALEVGTPVFFHLHNHGQNTWNFSTILLARH